MKNALSYVDFIRGPLGLFCLFTFFFLILCKNFTYTETRARFLLKKGLVSLERLERDIAGVVHESWDMGLAVTSCLAMSTLVEHTGLCFENRKTLK